MKYQLQTESAVSDTVTVYGQSDQLPVYAMAAAVNTLALKGAVNPKAELQIEAPFYVTGEWCRAVNQVFLDCCRQQGVTAGRVRMRKNPLIGMPCVTVTALACAEAPEKERPGSSRGCEILLAGWIGMEGMLRILEEAEEELQYRFSKAFLEQIRGYREALFLGNRLTAEDRRATWYSCQVADGGILSALWDLALELGAGVDLDLKTFPLLQETIEVCEHYRVNPYQLASAGAFLLVTEDGSGLAEQLAKRRIPCAVIGRVTDSHDKIIRNGEEVRYIDRPAPDEIWKILEIVKGDGR